MKRIGFELLTENLGERTEAGPGRMARALLGTSLANIECWSEQCRRGSAAAFAALAQNPSLIEPMRAAYGELRRQIAQDGLPPGVGDAVMAAIDGLWLYWVLGLIPVDQAMIMHLRQALAHMLAQGGTAAAAEPARLTPDDSGTGPPG